MYIDYLTFYKLPTSKRTKLVELAKKVQENKMEMGAAALTSLLFR